MKGDGADNLRYALNLKNHNIYSGDINQPPQPGFSRLPGVPLLMCISLLWSNPGSYGMLIPNILAGCGILLIVFAFLASFGMPLMRLRIFAALFAWVPVADYYASQHYPEVPATFLVVLSFAFLYKGFNGEKRKLYFILSGIAAGAAALFRPELLFHIPLAAGMLLLMKSDSANRIAASLLFIAGSVIALAPWGIRNMYQSGEMSLLGNNFFIETRTTGDGNKTNCANGLYKWLNTWHFREDHVKMIAWDFRAADLDALPEFAFDSRDEKKRLMQWQMLPAYTCGVDDSLAALADFKAEENRLKTHFLLPLMRMFFLLVRDGRHDSLDTGGLPVWIVQSGYWVFAIFASLVNLFALGAIRIFRKLPPMLKIFLIFGGMRLAFFAFFYHVENRYMMLWFPEFFLLAVFLFDTVSKQFRKTVTPVSS